MGTVLDPGMKPSDCYCSIIEGKNYLCQGCAAELKAEVARLKERLEEERGEAEESEKATECFTQAVAGRLGCKPFFQHILEALDDPKKVYVPLGVDLQGGVTVIGVYEDRDEAHEMLESHHDPIEVWEHTVNRRQT